MQSIPAHLNPRIRKIIELPTTFTNMTPEYDFGSIFPEYKIPKFGFNRNCSMAMLPAIGIVA